MSKIYDYFKLEAGTRDFIGHAMALHLDDSYMTRPARETYDRIVLYTSSVAKYGKTPYIYPLYGLGELPQGFARLSAIYGGTYMLDKSIDEIVTDKETGKFVGVRSGDETVKADQLIGDPTYFMDPVGGKDKVRETAKVVRAICLLKHPIPNTADADSVQLIIPQNQVGRKHDIYIASLSHNHNVLPAGMHLAIVSTIIETSTPSLELKPGLDLLGSIHEKFISISSVYEPIDPIQDKDQGIFVTRSLDATSHVETLVEDVKEVWRRVTDGKKLELKKREDGEGAQVQN